MALPTNEILSACLPPLSPPPLSPSHPLLVGNPTRVPGCSHNQISSHQKASEQTAGPFSWYSITDAAGRNYLCVPAQALAPLLLRDGLLHTESSAANGAVRRRSPAATQLLLSTISLFSLALSLSICRCVVVAVILAILCAYSLWKKRRTLCGWGFTEHHTQSEGDSAGSCYAPPQYSRCNSFHHPPPPYTEVSFKSFRYDLRPKV